MIVCGKCGSGRSCDHFSFAERIRLGIALQGQEVLPKPPTDKFAWAVNHHDEDEDGNPLFV